MSQMTPESNAADNTVRSSVHSSIYVTLINLSCHKRRAAEGFSPVLFVYILQCTGVYSICVYLRTFNCKYVPSILFTCVSCM